MSNAYRPPEFDAPIDLDLSRNEGRPSITEITFGPDELAALTSRYPDTTGLRQAIASKQGLATGRVLVTAGGDDALFRCLLANAGRPVVATTPSFEMIGRYASQVRSPLVEIPWWDDDFPVDDVLDRAEDGAMAVIVSPNNPTGNVIAISDLRKIADAFSFVVLDGAYMEFADGDLTAEALTLDNVVVIRTLSKAYGLAGLRVGYLLGRDEEVERLAAFGSPYSMSALSAALATEALARGADEGYFAEVARERLALTDLLEELECRPLSSQANFVLATDVDPDWLVPAAASLGVGLRRFRDRPDLERSVRIGLPGDASEFERLETTLRTVLAPEALLFDMDSVIADVRDSFLEKWSNRLPMAIVTREDAPSKADPAPVRLAMERLGVSRGWMLSNTVDDLRAARAAGVVPIGVAVPGDDRSALSPAARIVESVNEIEEVLDATQS